MTTWPVYTDPQLKDVDTRVGFLWQTGKEIDQNDGKGTKAQTWVSYPAKSTSVECTDTLGWINGSPKKTCSDYAANWCKNGAARADKDCVEGQCRGSPPTSSWALGSTFNYPEINCCVCAHKNDARHYEHRQHRFYLVTTTDGTSKSIFGPWTLEVGCSRTGLNFTDTPQNMKLTKYIGTSIDLMTFKFPQLSLSWCKVIKNVVVSTNPEQRIESVKTCEALYHNDLKQRVGGWAQKQKNLNVGPVTQPCNKFQLWDISKEQFFYFKVMTITTNNVNHVSPTYSVNVTCGTRYNLVMGKVKATQNQPTSDKDKGFTLPSWTPQYEVCGIA